MIKMGVDLKFLEPHRSLCAGHEAVYRLGPTTAAMQLDTSENNPLEMLSTEMLMSLTRRIDDFPAFFKHTRAETANCSAESLPVSSETWGCL